MATTPRSTELRDTRDELCGYLDRLGRCVAGRLEDGNEREMLRDTMADERRERRYETGVLRTTNPMWT